jgi:hypothetical protein
VHGYIENSEATILNIFDTCHNPPYTYLPMDSILTSVWGYPDTCPLLLDIRYVNFHRWVSRRSMLTMVQRRTGNFSKLLS